MQSTATPPRFRHLCSRPHQKSYIKLDRSPLPPVDVSSTHDSLRNERFQQLLSSKLDNTILPADLNVACRRTCDAIMSSALEAYGHRLKAQHDWFRDNADLVLPALAAKWSARLKVTARNSRSQGVTCCKTHRSTSHSFCSLALLGKS